MRPEDLFIWVVAAGAGVSIVIVGIGLAISFARQVNR